MNEQHPTIYDYYDFRKFISDYHKVMQQRDRSYTKSRICQLLGLPNSRSYMSDVLNGKKLSKTFVERFIRLFEFTPEEADYFRALVQYNQAEDPSERELYFEQVISFNKTPQKYLYEQSYRYYKDWYNPAIRAILNVYNFNGKNYSSLAKTLFPPITPSQAKEAVKLLIQMDLLEKNNKGFYKPTVKTISTEEYSRNESIKKYQINCLDRAKYVINSDGPPGVVATNTISISESGRARIEKQIERFRTQIRTLVQDDDSQAETVYHMDILFLPMMKKDI
ncbi:MAG TPA: TIGR02147 family protein [Chitinispirillaceae bacterium]|nr:TIGR02147 family protein [Chitinispirillaceae bacterium]